MQVESTSKPMLTVDEVEQIQRKKIATIIGHVFQLTYVRSPFSILFLPQTPVKNIFERIASKHASRIHI